jgi:hypothetical protein
MTLTEVPLMNDTRGESANRWFGFTPDERQATVQGAAARNAYLTTLVAATAASSYQLSSGWPGGALWPVALSIALSLVMLIVRRVTFAGLGPTDERVRQLRVPIYRWAYITLVLGLFLYGSFLFGARGDTLAMLFWTFCYLVSLPVIWLTHVWYDTAQGRFWLWLLVAVAVLGSLTPSLALLGVGLVQELRAESPPPALRELLPLLFFLTPPLLFGLAAAGAAWRSWQVERDADG